MTVSTFIVFIGVFFIALGTAVSGFFLNLSKRSLLSDTLAHSLLPGVCLSFILFQQKSIWLLSFGGIITGLASVFFTQYLTKKTKLKSDAAMAINLSAFFGLGVLLLSIINQQNFGNQSGLESILFGKAAAMRIQDAVNCILICTVSIVTLWIIRKPLIAESFSPQSLTFIGLPTKFFQTLFLIATAAILSVAVQAVGVVLVSGLVIIPPIIARKISNRLIPVIVATIVFSAISAIAGTLLSAYFNGISTGPVIILVLGTLFFVSLILFKKNYAA